MKITDPEILGIERELKILTRRLDAGNCISCSENEADYLMSGNVTELIDKLWSFSMNEKFSYIKIYGVVAQDRSRGRYVWIYVHYAYRLWKCHRIEDAYQIVEKVREKIKMEEKIAKLTRRFKNKQKLLQISNN